MGPTTRGCCHLLAAALFKHPFPAKLSSEGTIPICRLPLQTFHHQLETSHLGYLMRLLVRSGGTYSRSHDFSEKYGAQGGVEKTDAIFEWNKYIFGQTNCHTLFRGVLVGCTRGYKIRRTPSPQQHPYKKKTTFPLFPSFVSWCLLKKKRRRACVAIGGVATAVYSRFRDFNLIPFQGEGGVDCSKIPLLNRLPISL